MKIDVATALIERRYRKMKNPAPCGAGFFTGIGFAADQPGACSDATTR
jgi:hypothetical protein